MHMSDCTHLNVQKGKGVEIDDCIEIKKKT